ncbi:hypothetical protein LOTGIDRAFT_166907 [Lottia gigantea]|uniref:Uncharacterized protein n=1 Tax=Lottia gigantea TaxID=225164 RepID=V3Z720_LOTGI|nr:hypothetical protein LOTGIDRAFT_166907 [Lottia gigantea]ESO86638.1 hypothetical protein LOTGIDRAFT_166907 [Lottia gigantea]
MGKKEKYVNDVELYDLLRSKELYREQNKLQKSLEKQIREISKNEKILMSRIECQRQTFLKQFNAHSDRNGYFNVESLQLPLPEGSSRKQSTNDPDSQFPFMSPGKSQDCQCISYELHRIQPKPIGNNAMDHSASKLLNSEQVDQHTILDLIKKHKNGCIVDSQTGVANKCKVTFSL